MTVRRSDNGTLVLDGVCPVEDAEALLQLLQTAPSAVVDWTQCRQLHTAVLQVILAAGIVPVGPCGDAWIAEWAAPKLAQKPLYAQSEPRTTGVEPTRLSAIYPVRTSR
jgi:hypothetical protein